MYLVGYFQLSVAWLIGPIILLVIRDQTKKDKQIKIKLAQAAALSNEKDVLARISDLPAWVSLTNFIIIDSAKIENANKNNTKL